MGKNDTAWAQIFEHYDIVNRIENDGMFRITASQIKEYREPRLMAKIDHAINLPKIFRDNRLAILPVSRGDYIISHFNAYHRFEEINNTIISVSLPEYIQSLEYNSINSESIALNSASASGVLADFLQDEDLVPTVSGRMGSGRFDFDIANIDNDDKYNVVVNNSQIEIDAAYEGVNSLALFEAKNDISDDFIIRQIYYPYRLWQSKITKPVRPIFLVFSNGIYHLYEYAFEEVGNYNSLVLMSQKNYALEETDINIADIQNILNSVELIQEPNDIPFPQADSFERVINLCELLKERDLNRNDVTENYDFDIRQTNYYSDAARYLGLIDKSYEGVTPVYSLNNLGRNILSLNYKKRQIAFCKAILSHKVFNISLRKYLENGVMPSRAEIVSIMRESNLYNIYKSSTYERRASTIRGWIDWIIGLINID